jgi:hypothetical protein
MYPGRALAGFGVKRRDFLRIMAGAGVATACTPVRIGLQMYPRDFHEHPEIVEETLRAFVLTVVPGVPESDPNLTRVFHDDLFRLEAHRGWLAYDLCRRAGDRTGDRHFASLPYADREGVVADALEAGGVTRRLYTAAVFVTQIAVYASIYDDDSGCHLWDYDGPFRIESTAGLRDPYLDEFRAITTAGSGNPV